MQNIWEKSYNLNWNAKDIGDYEDYEDVMLQFFFIKRTEEGREIFNMKIFCIVVDLNAVFTVVDLI